MTINELIDAAYANSVAHGWHDKERSFAAELLLIISEISEAAEEYRNWHEPDEIYYVTDANGIAKPEGVPIEISDIIIRIGDLCGEYKINLENALRIKMAYNQTRTYRHGNKRI